MSYWWEAVDPDWRKSCYGHDVKTHQETSDGLLRQAVETALAQRGGPAETEPEAVKPTTPEDADRIWDLLREAAST